APSGPKASGRRCLKVGPAPEVAVETAPVSGPEVARANAATSTSFRDMCFTFSPFRPAAPSHWGCIRQARSTSHTAAGATWSQERPLRGGLIRIWPFHAFDNEHLDRASCAFERETGLLAQSST